ncbi:MAG: hypothetical protein FWC50_11770 [Planctomycetaceae bacterium]|nr:hypothetical protein [Planctomycetaceae bacterium]
MKLSCKRFIAFGCIALGGIFCMTVMNAHGAGFSHAEVTAREAEKKESVPVSEKEQSPKIITGDAANGLFSILMTKVIHGWLDTIEQFAAVCELSEYERDCVLCFFFDPKNDNLQKFYEEFEKDEFVVDSNRIESIVLFLPGEKSEIKHYTFTFFHAKNKEYNNAVDITKVTLPDISHHAVINYVNKNKEKKSLFVFLDNGSMEFGKGNTLSVIARKDKAVETLPVNLEELRKAKVEPVRPRQSGNDEKKMPVFP